MANVYIDGFNLYYCAVKGTSFKWLDLNKLCSNLFSGKHIDKIYYFTAKIRAPRHDPNASTRQEIYWRALKTLPNLEIIKGHFVRWPRWMPKYPLQYIGSKKTPVMVQVERTEEKGSDVNLAAMLVYNNSVQNNNESIVISNDSDLSLAIKIVTSNLNQAVIVVNPNRTSRARKDKNCKISIDLKKVATNYLPSINDNVLANSLFPDTFSDSIGTIRKPSSW
ncbi:MAG TPA: NYN domain-containing protein [Dehalococcoidia bacterium]|nr:NYN domain-containing protein [Dehalococcoidia bacterium]